jgi:hypothetical protein
MHLKRYRAWRNLITYARYYRLTVATAWTSYEAFARDVPLPPGRNWALKRMDHAKGFDPGNVQWEPKQST